MSPQIGRDRRRRWILAALVALALAGGLMLARQSDVARRAADFTIGYSAARLVLAGHPDAVYDQQRLGPVMTQVSGGAIDPSLPYAQPLLALTPMLPLALLPLDIAYRLWQVCSLLLFLGALYLLQRAQPLGTPAPAWGFLALLASVPAWSTLSEGQMTPLLFLGAALLVFSLRSSTPLLAAVGGLLLASKPQYVPAYLLALLCLRSYRLFGAALAGSAVTMASPLIAGGINGAHAYLQVLMTTHVLAEGRLIETWSGFLGSFLPAGSRTAALLAGTIFALGVAGLAAWLFRWRPQLNETIAVSGLVALLASPYAFPHDLVLLVTPAWFGFALTQAGRLASPVWALALVDLALIADVAGAPFAVAPLLLTAVLVWAAVDFRRRAAARLPALAPAA
ncbi:MAG TPA: glycosyltransferase family 87 protein [Chloroflexota bacterium]|nr:glycosyltransferase family 87 protein [Chloroflexota bacterium]